MCITHHQPQPNNQQPTTKNKNGRRQTAGGRSRRPRQRQSTACSMQHAACSMLAAQSTAAGIARGSGLLSQLRSALGFGFGLRASGFGLRVAGGPLRARAPGLRASGFGLRGARARGQGVEGCQRLSLCPLLVFSPAKQYVVAPWGRGSPPAHERRKRGQRPAPTPTTEGKQSERCAPRPKHPACLARVTKNVASAASLPPPRLKQADASSRTRDADRAKGKQRPQN